MLSFNFNFQATDLSQDEYAKDKLNTPQLHQYIADQQFERNGRLKHAGG
jgi:hypothetical protein